MYRIIKVSNTVRRIPMDIGIPNKIYNAMLDPTTYWISEPIIAISHMIHRKYLLELG